MREVRRSLGVVEWTVLSVAAMNLLWFGTAVIGKTPLAESFGLASLQLIFSAIGGAILLATGSRKRSAFGPSLSLVVAFYCLFYYGVSNLGPALYLRWASGGVERIILNPVPRSPVWAYEIATVSAIFMLMGLVAGIEFLNALIPLTKTKTSARDRLYVWLPSYRTAFWGCVCLLIVAVIGTLKFGSEFNPESINNAAAGEAIAQLSLGQQLVFHGIIYLLPVTPLVAGAAVVQTGDRQKQRRAAWLLVFACIVVSLAFVIWGMRSLAMLAIAMPIVLLVFAGKLRPRTVALPAGFLVIAIYSGMTYVRNSELPGLIDSVGGFSKLSVADIVGALRLRSVDEGVVGRAAFDLSYRTAGLEGAAALITAQREGRLSLKWGKVAGAGFLQALPAVMRQGDDFPERIKTAPAYFKVFESGDWVTMVLDEFLMDFGPYIIFLPAAFAGFGLALLDRGMLSLGKDPRCEGILIIRLAFFASIVWQGSSLADMSLMFFKATIGYSTFLLLLGFALQFHFRYGIRRMAGANSNV